ncbi:MAG: ATP synthase F1 subunit delta [Nitrospirota bacterium]
MTGIVARRYAKAFIDLAEEHKNLDRIKSDIDTLVLAVKEQPLLLKFFGNPRFTLEQKQDVIGLLARKLKLHQTSKRFFEYLAEAGRIRHLAEIHEAFMHILAERQNRATAEVTTAVPVKSADLVALRKKLEALTGKKIDLDVQIDPSLLGGMKARIGSIVYDSTIKNQMEKMRAYLMN